MRLAIARCSEEREFRRFCEKSVLRLAMVRVCQLAAFLVALTTTGMALACSCGSRSVAEATGDADVVFAGIVKAVRLVDTDRSWEPRVIVDFSVSRVWKGDVGKEFTLHTNLEASSCSGMWREQAKVGEVLLVYGYKQDTAAWKTGGNAGASNALSFTVRRERRAGTDRKLLNSVDDTTVTYSTDICTRTSKVVYAVEDFDELGEYRELAPLEQLPDRKLVESLRPEPNGLPAECGELADGKKWWVLPDGPFAAKELIALIESGVYAVPAEKRAPLTDYWVSDGSGRVGLCRVSTIDSIVCGEANMVFSRSSDDTWQLGPGGVSSYCK
jgi:hypothetical protein